MAEKKETKKQPSPFMEVVLIDKHTHQGKEYKKGDKITIRKHQLEKMRLWGKVK